MSKVVLAIEAFGLFMFSLTLLLPDSIKSNIPANPILGFSLLGISILLLIIAFKDYWDE